MLPSHPMNFQLIFAIYSQQPYSGIPIIHLQREYGSLDNYIKYVADIEQNPNYLILIKSLKRFINKHYPLDFAAIFSDWLDQKVLSVVYRFRTFYNIYGASLVLPHLELSDDAFVLATFHIFKEIINKTFELNIAKEIDF